MKPPEMDINEFTEKFESLFEDVSPRFTPATSFKELSGWNSLRALYLIAMVDADFGVSFDTNDLRNSRTIEDVFRNIQNKLS